mmetsp:Transcript_16949/g.36811  ORF Transcript_16949/g.36811 Transcript_16949/m.36811 type:complete len:526 (-) Transcript_16949:29-1606(-)
MRLAAATGAALCRAFPVHRPAYVTTSRAAFSSTAHEDPGMCGLAAHTLRSRLDASQATARGSSTYYGDEELFPLPMRSISPSTVLSHAGLPLTHGKSSFDDDSANVNTSISSRRNIPLSPPLHLATTYSRPASGKYDDAVDGKGQIYGRTDNATREILEQTVGKVELMPYRRDLSGSCRSDSTSQPETVACSSGMAAISTLLLSHPAPVEIILPADVYHGVPTLLHTVLQHHGMKFTSVCMNDLGKVEKALRKAASSNEGAGSVVLWIESPSNPLLNVADVPSIAALIESVKSDLPSSSGNISAVVDSTLFPPPLSTPLLSGADFVVHSATKYLGGHSDALLGLITASPYTKIGRELGQRIRQVQQVTGCQASPFDSWLVLRGLRTLHVRLERQCKTALRVANYLSEQDIVLKVHYPGLPSHPDHDVASRIMPDGLYGGVLSFELADARFAMAVAGAVRVIERGTSLGGTETLVEHRASIEPAERVVSPPGLLRMSIGLEDADDIVQDLDRALWVADQVVQSNDT